MLYRLGKAIVVGMVMVVALLFSRSWALANTIEGGTHNARTLAAQVGSALVSATKTDALADDADSDGKADAGDTIHYTVDVENNGTGNANGVTFSDTPDANTTLVPGSINVSPLAFNDSYAAVGNTLLEVGRPASSNVAVRIANGSVTANDTEFLGDSFDATPISNGTTANGGTVNLFADGSFTYLPAAGFAGTDSFTYTISDDGVGGVNALTDEGTVTITVSERVWYVDSAAATNGDGRSNSPFNSLAAVNGASDADGAGDTLYLRAGSGTYGGGLALESNQTLIGEGAALVVGSNTLAPAGSAPTLTNASGNGITLAQNNTVRGLTVSNPSGVGISGSDFGNLTVGSTTISGGTDGVVLQLTGGTSTINLTDSTVQSSSTNVVAPGDGVYLAASGSTNVRLNVNNSTIKDHLAFGLQVQGSGASVANVKVTNSTFQNNHVNVDVASVGTGSLTYDISNNTFGNSNLSRAEYSHYINVFTGGSTTANGQVINNTIDGSGPELKDRGIGIRINNNDNANARVEVRGNDLRDIGQGGGVEAVSRTGTTGRLDILLLNNTIEVEYPNPLSPAFQGIFVDSRSPDTICANIQGNTATSTGAVGIRVVKGSTATFLLEGYTSGSVATFLGTPRNTATTSSSGTGYAGGTCNAPDLSALAAAQGSAFVASAWDTATQVQAPVQAAPLDAISIGTLPAGKDVTIVFDVTVNSLAADVNHLSNQGTVSGDNFSNVLTDDPDTAAANDATRTTADTQPGVTINQAAGQNDPTDAQPINFTVVFEEPVSGFTSGDVTLSGAAGATATVTGGPSTYNVAVNGVADGETVVATIAADVASDSAGNGNLASTSNDNSVTLALNRAPVADDDSAATDEDNAVTVNVLANDSDEDGDTLTVTAVSNPANGTATTDGTSVTYTPDTDFNGTDSFTYTANDGNGGTDTATVNVTVNPVNDAPSFTAGGNVTVDEDSGAYSAAWASNVSAGPANESGQSVSFQVTGNTNAALFSSAPAVAADGTLSFTPAANANGSADVTVVLKDNGGGDDTSASATFTINVTPVNDAPTANANGPYTGNEGSAVTFDGSGSSDIEGDALTYEWDLNYDGVTFDVDRTGANPSTTFPDDVAARTVALRVTDTGGLSDIDTSSLTVNNVAPTLSLLQVTGGGAACLTGNDVTLNFSFTDPAGSNDSYTGTINWGDGSPTTSFNSSPVSQTHHYATAGKFTITVTVSDEDGGSDQETKQVSLLYNLSNFQSPINNNGSSIFRYNSTIPVKVRITDCLGNPVAGLAPTLGWSMLSAVEPSDPVNEPFSTSAADTGNVLRYTGDGYYQYNFSTKSSLPEIGATYYFYVREAHSVAPNGQVGQVSVRFGIRTK
jgi:uncharacterized repeat protein (TIGR01451 family)